MKEQQIMNKLESYKDNENADKLEALFDLQNTFDEYIKEKRNLDYSDKEYWIQKLCTAVITEACELNDATNWKWWKNKKEIDWDNIKEEVIDLWHFLISVSVKIGISPKDVIDQYINKNLENYKRQLGTSERDGYQYNRSKL